MVSKFDGDEIKTCSHEGKFLNLLENVYKNRVAHFVVEIKRFTNIYGLVWYLGEHV